MALASTTPPLRGVRPPPAYKGPPPRRSTAELRLRTGSHPPQIVAVHPRKGPSHVGAAHSPTYKATYNFYDILHSTKYFISIKSTIYLFIYEYMYSIYLEVCIQYVYFIYYIIPTIFIAIYSYIASNIYTNTYIYIYIDI